MPVQREDQERRTGSRGRRWLWALAILPLVFVGLLLLPVARPVTIEMGSYCLYVERVEYLPGPVGNSPQGFHTRHIPTGGLDLDGPGRWVVTGGCHTAWFRIGRWGYWMAWWHGQKVAAPRHRRP